MFASCSNLNLGVDNEGCITAQVVNENYRIGHCPDGSSKVEWSNADGVDLRAVFPRGIRNGDPFFQYQVNGEWLTWAQNADVDLGDVPGVVQTQSVDVNSSK